MADGTYTFEINPIAASRPRVSRYGHAYFSGPYKAFRQICDTDKWASIPEGLIPSGGPISVDVALFAKQPKTTKLAMPKPDVDNYAKAILDQFNDVLWVDDALIKTLTVTKDWAPLGRGGYFVISIEELTNDS